MSDLAGKTIKRLVDLDYDGQALIFTDGTAAHFEGGGYYYSVGSGNAETEMSVTHMEALLADRDRDSLISAARTRARNELKARIKRNVSPGAWAHWAKIHITPMESMMDAMADQMRYDINRQINGGFWANSSTIGTHAVIPFAKDQGAPHVAVRPV